MAVCPTSFQGLPLSGGTITGNLTVTGTITGTNGPYQQLQATTGAAGFALQNGTPTIISWTAPNDGNMHRAQIYLGQQVTVAETGGAVQVTSPLPGGAGTLSDTPFAGGSGAGISEGWIFRLVAPGGVVTVAQSSALTVGTAKVWAEIWGS